MKSPVPNQLLSQCRSQKDLHMLYSMLPKEFTLYPKQQFKKTKDFYKPDQCIWNNPHRTSERLYKYYHKGVDEYKRVKEPVIMEQEERDREYKQVSRIRNLSLKRQETRFRFHSKQLERLSLQNKSGIIRDASTHFISQIPTLTNKPQNTSHNQSTNTTILRRSNSQSLRIPSTQNTKLKFLYKSIKTTKEQQTSAIQKSYLQSIENFDAKNNALMKTIKKSEKQMKDQIRQNFMKQKENNHVMNSTSMQGFAQGKLVKTTFNKKKTLKFDFSNMLRKTINKSNIQHQRS